MVSNYSIDHSKHPFTPRTSRFIKRVLKEDLSTILLIKSIFLGTFHLNCHFWECIGCVVLIRNIKWFYKIRCLWCLSLSNRKKKRQYMGIDVLSVSHPPVIVYHSFIILRVTLSNITFLLLIISNSIFERTGSYWTTSNIPSCILWNILDLQTSVARSPFHCHETPLWINK